MGRFVIHQMSIPGLTSIQRLKMGDERGFLERLFCAEELSLAGWTESINQINHTYTREKGTVRGLHYQHHPYQETKLISCLRGEVWDVVVDLRPESETYLQWHAEKLTEANGLALLIPKGCAHGFQTMTDDVSLVYLHDVPYTPGAEAGLNPFDKKLSINWPLAVTNISQRDQRHPSL